MQSLQQEGSSAFDRLRARRIGLWTGALESMTVTQLRESVNEFEQSGYGSLWWGEAYGRESLTLAMAVAAHSSELVIGTGIANIYARGAMATAAGARLIEATAPGRFVLGLGVSHKPLVERDRKQIYAGPIETMRAYLDDMEWATYFAADPQLPPIVLAALGPKMLELSRDRTAGAHPYLVTPEHTRSARAALGPDALLVTEQAAVLGQSADEALRRAHDHLTIYTGLPNYRRSWARLGFDESDFGKGGSDRLAHALVAMGDIEKVMSRVHEHLDAGADHVCLQFLGPDVFTPPYEEWRAFAKAL